MSAPRSKLRAALAVAAVAVVLVVLLPTPAFAHATLVSTDPGSGQVVDAPPKAITLRLCSRVICVSKSEESLLSSMNSTQ